MFKHYLVWIILVFILSSYRVFACDCPYEDRKRQLIDWIATYQLGKYVDAAAKGSLKDLQWLCFSAPDIVDYPVFGGNYFAIEQANQTDETADIEFFNCAYGKDGAFLNYLDSTERVKKLRALINRLKAANCDKSTNTCTWLSKIDDALSERLIFLLTSRYSQKAKFPSALVDISGEEEIHKDEPHYLHEKEPQQDLSALANNSDVAVKNETTISEEDFVFIDGKDTPTDADAHKDTQGFCGKVVNVLFNLFSASGQN